MESTKLRTAEELRRAQWAERFAAVADGDLYDEEGEGAFPIRKYFKNKLLGSDAKMLQLNAGAALIDQMVSDTITSLTVQIGEETNSELENEVNEWLDGIDYVGILEEAARDWFSVGYCAQQPVRTVEGDKNGYTVVNIDPSIWYPEVPAFTHQDFEEARIINVFSVRSDGLEEWYAFVEKLEVGKVARELYKLDKPTSLDGKKVPLNSLSRFAEVQDSVATDLSTLGVFQSNRRKSSRKSFGDSVLTSIWDILEEVSEIQTQIRQERIKHFRAKLAAPERSLQKASRVDDTQAPLNSKQAYSQEQQAVYDVNQEIFPIPSGGIVPQYIQRDLQTIEKGSVEIDKLLSRAASIVGAPRSIFNLDERGTVHVDTEKRKDRRYVRHILRAQHKMQKLAENVIQTYFEWNGKKNTDSVRVILQSPFEMGQEEKVRLMREMNPSASYVSQKRAVKEIWPDMSVEEREELLEELQTEQPTSSLLDSIPVELNATA